MGKSHIDGPCTVLDCILHRAQCRMLRQGGAGKQQPPCKCMRWAARTRSSQRMQHSACRLKVCQGRISSGTLGGPPIVGGRSGCAFAHAASRQVTSPMPMTHAVATRHWTWHHAQTSFRTAASSSTTTSRSDELCCIIRFAEPHTCCPYMRLLKFAHPGKTEKCEAAHGFEGRQVRLPEGYTIVLICKAQPPQAGGSGQSSWQLAEAAVLQRKESTCQKGRWWTAYFQPVDVPCRLA